MTPKELAGHLIQTLRNSGGSDASAQGILAAIAVVTEEVKEFSDTEKLESIRLLRKHYEKTIGASYERARAKAERSLQDRAPKS